MQLTSKGRTVVRATTNMRCQVIDEVFADWSDEDLDTLADLLQRMARTVSERAPEVIAGLERDGDEAHPPMVGGLAPLVWCQRRQGRNPAPGCPCPVTESMHRSDRRRVDAVSLRGPGVL